jgi:SRSO17 transposase
MNLVRLSEDDLKEVYTLFDAFHENYSPFFFNHTKSVATSALDYLQGQLFTKQEMNMTQFVREVPDSDYEAMQHFISDSPWDDKAIISKLKKDVLTLLGDCKDGALIIDESGIEKQGKMSVGVARQYCGRLGKVENCQVGVYLAYANSEHTSLIDYRLYLPESWIDDTQRRQKCGVPLDVSFQTKAQLALEMIRASLDVPFSWVCMDCHYGEQPWLLKELDSLGLCYMAEIPSDTRIFPTFPKTEIPQRKGHRGRHPTTEKLVEGEALPIPVRHFALSLDESQWTTLSVRKTERGWLIADFAAVRVWHSVDNLPKQEVWLVMRRPIGGGDIRFAFSNAEANTSLKRLAVMKCRRYWVERALEDAKGEAGLDQYQVRGWTGWHHHMTMTLLAMLFLLQLTLNFREKAPMLTLQDAREILEEFLPRKSYSPSEFIKVLQQKHQARLSARQSHAKRQKQKLKNIKS